MVMVLQTKDRCVHVDSWLISGFNNKYTIFEVDGNHWFMCVRRGTTHYRKWFIANFIVIYFLTIRSSICRSSRRTTWLHCGSSLVSLSVRTTYMVWEPPQSGLQHVLITTLEETIFPGYWYRSMCEEGVVLVYVDMYFNVLNVCMYM